MPMVEMTSGILQLPVIISFGEFLLNFAMHLLAKFQKDSIFSMWFVPRVNSVMA